MGTKTVYKWFFVWDFDKEEAWLNEMAAQGWVLESVGWCRFTFRACQPGAYTVRLELLADAPDSAAGRDYIDFVESTGAQCVGHVLRWTYFRRLGAEGSFDLFSDVDSRVAHLDRIVRMVLVVGGANFVIGILNSSGFGRVNLLCAALLFYGAWRLREKRVRLQLERRVHE